MELTKIQQYVLDNDLDGSNSIEASKVILRDFKLYISDAYEEIREDVQNCIDVSDVFVECLDDNIEKTNKMIGLDIVHYVNAYIINVLDEIEEQKELKEEQNQ